MVIKGIIDVEAVKKINEMPGAWTHEDYRQILELCEYPGVSDLSATELPDMCLMALTEFEPEEVAEKLLGYRLGDLLTEGQIQQLSHEMQEDRVAEEYPNILAHHQLFNINQLLGKAFKHGFPSSKAVSAIINLELSPNFSWDKLELDKDIIARLLVHVLPSNNLISRLYSDQLEAGALIEDAEGIIWSFDILHKSEQNLRVLIFSSAYWLEDLDEMPGQPFEIVLKREEDQD